MTPGGYHDANSLHRNSLYGLQQRDSMIDVGGEYRPVSHGEVVAGRGYHHQGSSMSGGHGNEKRTSSIGYGASRGASRRGSATQQTSYDGGMGLERRQSYGTQQGPLLQLTGTEQRKSMQVHVGVEEDDGAGYAAGVVEEARRRSQSQGRTRERARRRESGHGQREREREYAY
jgi:hypothetical protein